MNQHDKHTHGKSMHVHLEEEPEKSFVTSGKNPGKVDISNKQSYVIRFSTSATPIYPDQEVALSFVPAKGKEKEHVSLEVQHGKKLHLIIVSEGLSYFNHIHPEENELGEYVARTFFPYPGNYTLFVDYKPVGGDQAVDKFELIVKGNTPRAKAYSKEKLTGYSGRYSFSLLHANGQIIAGSTNQIDGIVRKDGKQIDVNTLEDYLGAKAHVVIISAKEKEFLHVHPVVKDEKLSIQADFNTAGIYRGWVQFMDKQQIYTIDLTLKVVGGNHVSSNQNLSKSHVSHNH